MLRVCGGCGGRGVSLPGEQDQEMSFIPPKAILKSEGMRRSQSWKDLGEEVSRRGNLKSKGRELRRDGRMNGWR